MPDEGTFGLLHICVRENNLLKYSCCRFVTVGLHTQFTGVGFVQLPTGPDGQFTFVIESGKMPLEVSQFVGSCKTIFGAVFLAGYKYQCTQQKESKCKSSIFHNHNNFNYSFTQRTERPS